MLGIMTCIMWLAELPMRFITFLLQLCGLDRLSKVQKRLDKVRDIIAAELEKAPGERDRERIKHCEETQLRLLNEIYALEQPTSGKITLYELADCPLPQLTARISPRSSSSKTRPRKSRTFEDVLPWAEFLPECTRLFRSLDNSKRIFMRPSLSGRPGPEWITSAADEAEVRGCIVGLTHSINTIVDELGGKVECTGGGSGRSASFTDLVARMTGSPSNPSALSALVVMDGMVKGEWQFQLERWETLEAALDDPKRTDAILQAVQQAFGDAVMDEAPMFFVLTYHVSLFFRRSPDVQDRRLRVSPPIWWDQRDPPARVCWAHALMEAGRLFHLKKSLPRYAVPHTGEGYLIFPAKAGQLAMAPTPALSMRLQARNEGGSGWEPEMLYSNHENASSDVSAASRQASRAGSAPGANPVILQEGLRVSDNLLGAGQFGHVLEGSYNGQQVAVKLYDLGIRGAAAAYETEKEAYLQLAALQGEVIPRMLCYGNLAHAQVPIIVTEMAGVQVTKSGTMPKQKMRHVLRDFHASDAAHGDVRLSNFVIDSMGKVLLLDLGHTVPNSSPDEREREEKVLKHLLE